jgi:hypothetical protein
MPGLGGSLPAVVGVACGGLAVATWTHPSQADWIRAVRQPAAAGQQRAPAESDSLPELVGVEVLAPAAQGVRPAPADFSPEALAELASLLTARAEPVRRRRGEERLWECARRSPAVRLC